MSQISFVASSPSTRFWPPAFEVDEMKVLLADAVNRVPERERQC